MAEQKECTCAAMRMLTRLSNLLNTWLENMDRAEPGLGQLMEEMHSHITEQISKPANSEAKGILKDRLDTIESKVLDASIGKIRYMAAVDDIRNAIHKSAMLRDVFLCNPYNVQETELSKEVFNALEILEVGEPVEAKKQLDRIYKELSCGA